MDSYVSIGHSTTYQAWQIGYGCEFGQMPHLAKKPPIPLSTFPILLHSLSSIVLCQAPMA